MGIQPILCNDPLLTQQSAKDECDINLIVERAKRGADLSQLTRQPLYGDFTAIPSFRESLLLVNAARDSFMALDANVRKRFHNDPAAFIEFLSDESNREEAVRLGLINVPEAPKVDPTLEEIKGLRKDLKETSNRKSVGVKDRPESD